MAFDPMDSSMDQEAVDDIVDAAIENNDVVLFMKGDARMPQCGFSERALELVTRYRPDVHAVDTLQSLDEFRVALEEHSGWETIPQAFVDGQFVGGSDILAELEERGELGDELNAADADPVDDDPDDEIQSPF
jgi:monothiol glutaredoxin